METQLRNVLMAGAVALLSASAAGADSRPTAYHVPGLVWREAFDAGKPKLRHWAGNLEYTVLGQKMTIVDHRTVEQLTVRFGRKGTVYSYWDVGGVPPTPLPAGGRLSAAIRLKSNVPVTLKINYRVEGTAWSGVLQGETARGDGQWETIRLTDIPALAGKAVAGFVAKKSYAGQLKPGDENRPMTLDRVALDLAAPEREIEIVLDDVALYDAGLYDPAQDVEGLPFRIAWAVRADKPPGIDGRMSDEEGWSKAAPLDNFTILGGGPQSPDTGAEARLLYDDAAVYIAVRCREKPGATIKAETTRTDGPVYTDDSVEIFLVPPGNAILGRLPEASRYFHLVVNAAGTRYDETGLQAPASWDAEWTCRAVAGADGWTVEMALPLEALGVHGPVGGVWQLNICRNRGEPAERSSWSPAERTFHEIDHFGRLLFVSGQPDADLIRSIVLREELRSRLAEDIDALGAARAAIAAAGTAPLARPMGDNLARLDKQAAELASAIRTMADKQVATRFAALKQRIEELSAPVAQARFDAEIARLCVAAPPAWAFCVLTGPAITNEHVLPGRPLPKSYRAADRLELTACPGEYEPLTFSIYSPNDLNDVRITVDQPNFNVASQPATRNSQLATPHSFVDVRLVKCWYQAGRQIWETSGRMLVSELLLKDDGLVVVDRKGQRNFLRTSKGLVDISDPKADLSGIDPKDAAELLPFQVAAGEIKQLWVTVRVPADAAPGKYDATVRIAPRNTAPVALPLSITVLPFALAASPLTYSIYYRGVLTHGPGSISSEAKSPVQYEAELRNMAAHGVDHPTVYDPPGELLEEVVAIRRRAGAKVDPFYTLGVTTGAPMTDQALQELRGRVESLVGRLRALGINQVYIYGIDEAQGEPLKAERKAFQIAHEAGAKVFVACYSGFFELVGDLLDLPIWSGRPDPAAARQVHGVGHRIFSYGNPQVGNEEPYTYRRNFGLGLWQVDYDGAMDYAYQHSFGHAWNDFDNRSCRDHVFAYPTVDGVIDTLAWEGFREGVDDVRYLATLLEAAGRRNQTEAVRAWAKGLDLGGDMDAIRRQIIQKILALGQ